jgi:hypothetical protein
MQLLKTIGRFACGIGILFQIGCEGGQGMSPAARDPEYSIGRFNATGAKLPEARIWWRTGDRVWLADRGTLGVGTKAQVAFQPGPIPATVHLEWTTPDGVKHSHLVEVASKIADPKKFHGVIWFKFVDFTDSGYRVVVIDYATGKEWEP